MTSAWVTDAAVRDGEQARRDARVQAEELDERVDRPAQRDRQQVQLHRLLAGGFCGLGVAGRGAAAEPGVFWPSRLGTRVALAFDDEARSHLGRRMADLPGEVAPGGSAFPDDRIAA